MKSKYFDHIKKDPIEPFEVPTWSVSYKKDSKGKGYYVFSFLDITLCFARFASLNDFLMSNGFSSK